MAHRKSKTNITVIPAKAGIQEKTGEIIYGFLFAPASRRAGRNDNLFLFRVEAERMNRK
jgi:hypothetical protein